MTTDAPMAFVVVVVGGGDGDGESRGERQTNINRDAVDVEFTLRSSIFFSKSINLGDWSLKTRGGASKTRG